MQHLLLNSSPSPSPSLFQTTAPIIPTTHQTTTTATSSLFFFVMMIFVVISIIVVVLKKLFKQEPNRRPTTNVGVSTKDRVSIMYKGTTVCKLSSMFKLVDDDVKNMTWVMTIENQNNFQRFIVIEFDVADTQTLQHLVNSFVFVENEKEDADAAPQTDVEDLGFIVIPSSPTRPQTPQTTVITTQESKQDSVQQLNQLVAKIWLYTLPNETANIRDIHNTDNKTFIKFKLPITFDETELDWKESMNTRLTPTIKEEIITLNNDTFNTSRHRLLCIRLALEQIPELLAIGCTLGSQDFTFELNEYYNKEEKKIITNNLTLLFMLVLNVLKLKNIPLSRMFIHSIIGLVFKNRDQVISLLQTLLLPRLPPNIQSYIKTIRHMVQFILL